MTGSPYWTPQLWKKSYSYDENINNVQWKFRELTSSNRSQHWPAWPFQLSIQESSGKSVKKLKVALSFCYCSRTGPLSFKLWHKFSGETWKKLLREIQGWTYTKFSVGHVPRPAHRKGDFLTSRTYHVFKAKSQLRSLDLFSTHQLTWASLSSVIQWWKSLNMKLLCSIPLKYSWPWANTKVTENGACLLEFDSLSTWCIKKPEHAKYVIQQETKKSGVPKLYAILEPKTSKKMENQPTNHNFPF